MQQFFNTIRPIFGGTFTRSQVNGIETLLAATDGLPIAHRAYLLATPVIETGRTMQPITEYGGRAYFDKYNAGTRIGIVLGNTQRGDGYAYRGRGYVQITGRTNYARAERATGAPLVKNPDGALSPDLAARILVRGCTEGWFTGKKLSDYLDGVNPDYIKARRVINGSDRAQEIARYAEIFEDALRTIEKPAPIVPANPLAAFMAAIIAIFKGLTR